MLVVLHRLGGALNMKPAWIHESFNTKNEVHFAKENEKRAKMKQAEEQEISYDGIRNMCPIS